MLTVCLLVLRTSIAPDDPTDSKLGPVVDPQAVPGAMPEAVSGEEPDLETPLGGLPVGQGDPVAGESPDPGNPDGRDPLESLISDAEVLQSDTSQGGSGTIRRTLYRTSLKYPLIRVDEHSEGGPGGEVNRRIEAMVADHVMVLVPPEQQLLFLGKIRQSTGIAVRKVLDTGEHFLVTSRFPADLATVDRILRELRRMGIGDSMPDYIAHAHKVPDDPSFSRKWGLHNTGQSFGTADADIDAPEAWEHGVGNRTVTVAVIDTGIDHDHPDLKDNMWKNARGEHGYDYVEDDTDPNDKTGARNKGHGTHVAGIIGATGDNATGVTGVCWKVQLMAVRVIDENDSAYLSDIISGVRFAVNQGADVINMSLGIRGARQGDLMYQELKRARDQGVLACISAGNGGIDKIGDNNDVSPQYPASYNLDNIISVAATDRNDELTGFSNYGVRSVDLAAPGRDILSTLPVVSQSSSGYGYASGTSMSSPCVAGAVALGLSLNPALDYASARSLLLLGVDSIDSLDGKVATGGRLNLHRFVELATSSNIETTVEDHVFTSGNGDGFVNPGEGLALRFKVTNAGGKALEGLSARFVVVSGGDLLEVTESTESIGDLGVGQSEEVASGFAFRVKPSVNLSGTVELRIDVSAAAKPEDIWSANYAFTIVSPARISGKVVRNGTGLGISGATVHYDGPVEGTATTGNDGSFDIAAVTGTYSVHATAPGLLDSAPADVHAPAADLSIRLGRAEVAFAPDSLSLRSEPDRQSVAKVSLADTGDAAVDLDYLLKLKSHGEGVIYAVRLENSRSVVRLNPETGAVEGDPLYSLPAGTFITDIFFDGLNLWIMDSDWSLNYSLKRIDLETGNRLATYPISSSLDPLGIWSDPEGLLVAASSFNSFTAKVYRLDSESGRLTDAGKEFPDLPGSVTLVSSAPKRESIFVVSGGEIWELDASSLAKKREQGYRLRGSNLISQMTHLNDNEILIEGLSLSFEDSMPQHNYTLKVFDLNTQVAVRTLEDAPSLSALALKDSPPPEWIRLRQAKGLLPGQGSDEVSMDVDTSGLGAGTYKATLVLHSGLLDRSGRMDITLQVSQYFDLIDWLESHGFEKGDLGNDPNGDGYSLLREYVFKGDPQSSGAPAGEPLITAASDGFEIDMLVRSHFPDDAVEIQHSMDLEAWQASEAGVDYRVLSTTEEGEDYERMRLRWLKNDENKLFIRAEATIDEDL